MKNTITKNYFEIIRPGINTTFQDLGRKNLYHIGIPFSGAMDKRNFILANTIAGNNENSPVIEFAYQGPLLKLIKGKTKIAITGNVFFQIIRPDKEILNGECNRTYVLNEGDQIDILATKKSVYGYMALQGGFNIKTFYKSVSVLSMAEIGPNEGKKIKIKDKINIKTESKDRSSGGRFSSKLIALEWAKIWVEIDKKKKLKEWCTSLYYGAKKEFSSKNGPFLKIY